MSDKNVSKIAKKLNLPIVKILVRGNTDHRKDLFLADGSRYFLWKDGELERDTFQTGEGMTPEEYTQNLKENR